MAARSYVGTPGRNGWRNRERAELFFRGEFYAWSARRGFTIPGNDPMTGQPLASWRPLDAAISRAANAAMARECFGRARAYPNPLAVI